MKKTNSFNFENKLKAYSTIALGVIGVGALNAQVVYHDVNPDRTFTASASMGDTMTLDINSDAILDFYFQFRTYNTADAQANLNTLGDTLVNKVMATLVSYTDLGYAVPLALNAPIAPGNVNFRALLDQAVLASAFSGTNYGNCDIAGDVYLGLRFAAGANTHYGWIRMSGISATGSTGILKDWAYQSTPNTQILAGQGLPPQAINDLSPENVYIHATSGKLHVRFNTQIEGNISVVNLMGQEVLSSRIDNRHMELNVNDLSKGVYIVSVKSNNNVYTKKININ